MRAWILASLFVPAALAAQQDAPLTVPTNLSRADEVRYAKSAAPSDVSKDAKVWVLENGHYVVAEQGTSGMACAVMRERARSFVPICGDAEADATVLAISRFETEQRLAGKSPDQVKAAVDRALASGKLTLPKRPVLTYMTSSAQVLTDPNGEHPSRFMPHLMVFYPNMQSKAMGIVASNSMDVPSVGADGTPTSRLIIVVRDWTEPEKPTR